MSNLTEPNLYNKGTYLIDRDIFVNDAEANFQYFLNSLNYDDSVKSELRKTYQIMIAGINNNTLTHNLGGGFTDITGLLDNSTEGVDYVGIVSYFLEDVLNRQSKYQKPEDTNKIKWDDTALSKALNKLLFGSGQGQYFLELDTYDENTKSRALTNRILEYNSAIDNIISNFDTLFSGFSVKQKTEAINKLNSMKSILNNGVNTNEYHALDKIVPGKYNIIFGTGKDISFESLAVLEQQHTDNNDFYKYLSDNNYNIPTTNDLQNFNLNTDFSGYDTLSELKITSMITNASDNDLYLLLMMGLSGNLKYNKLINQTFGGVPNNLNTNYVLNKVLDKLKPTLKITQNGLYYLPKLRGKNKAILYFWDKTNNKLIAKNGFEYNWFKQDLYNKFAISQGTSSYAQYFTQYKQQGGVLKADNGIKLPQGGQTDILTAINFNDAARLMFDGTNWVNRINRATNTSVPSTPEYDTDDATNIENLTWWKNWINVLTSNKNLAKSWALLYTTQWRPENSTFGDDWYDGLGNFNFNKFKTSTLWSDKKSGPGHDILRGNTWYIKDNDNIYYYSSVPEGYEVDGEGEVDTDNPFITKYKLKQTNNSNSNETNNSNSSLTTNSVDSSIIESDNPEFISTKLSEGSWKDVLTDLIPEGLAIGNYFNSVNANNRIAETLDDAQKPILKNTYELYSPITGAFSEMLLKNRQATDVMNLASTPITSDASLYLAGMLDANNRANQLRTAGFLADDKEIKRTSSEALKRVENNIARRSEVANFNSASIILNNKEKADIEAERIRNNSESLSNYLSGVESRIRSRIKTSREERQAYETKQDEIYYKSVYQPELDEISNAILDWTKANPDANISSQSWYSDILNRRLEIERRIHNDILMAYGSRRGYDYTDIFKDKPYIRRNWNYVINK